MALYLVALKWISVVLMGLGKVRPNSMPQSPSFCGEGGQND
ncbi:hypothetical protein RMSM_05985 [Rhodopirellula maiorica SM1]|uniref:Uncharacterized protein n=1 Tax=Rhodopirellula maiorica SM1 TaxID=1265738 RepID=M5RCI1_9BACT|nr:hypothetical protein RMSM_05985 [Rhodopirellula maiorica SM1]